MTYFIIHLGLIALPEEWFWAYLQGRLDQLWGTPKRFLGVDFGWGLIVSSLAFAHFTRSSFQGFIGYLSFFQPFFGWLRARTGNIGAAVLVHALSNVLLAVLSRMYGVIQRGGKFSSKRAPTESTDSQWPGRNALDAQRQKP